MKLRIEELKLSIEELKDMSAFFKSTRMGKYARAIDELISIRELKGDQVPVGLVVGWDKHLDENIISWTREGSELPVGTKLFTTPQKPVVPMEVDDDIIRDANRYRFLRDEDAWGEDSDTWDPDTRTGLISCENLFSISMDSFDAAIDARIAASDVPILNPAQKPVIDLSNVLKVPYKISGQRFTAYDSDDLHAAIEAAGGIVKDGE